MMNLEQVLEMIEEYHDLRLIEAEARVCAKEAYCEALLASDARTEGSRKAEAYLASAALTRAHDVAKIESARAWLRLKLYARLDLIEPAEATDEQETP